MEVTMKHLANLLPGRVVILSLADRSSVQGEWNLADADDQSYTNQSLISLDAFAAATAGRDPEAIGHLRLAAQTFGMWDEQAVALAGQCGMRFSDDTGWVQS
jgi:hypothetical protein